MSAEGFHKARAMCSRRSVNGEPKTAPGSDWVSRSPEERSGRKVETSKCATAQAQAALSSSKCPPPWHRAHRCDRSRHIGERRASSGGAAPQWFLFSAEPPSHRCDGGNRDSRKVDREHASLSSEVARIDFSVVLFDAPAAKGETQTEPRSIHSSLLERAEQLVEIRHLRGRRIRPRLR